MSCEEGDRQTWIWQLADAQGASAEQLRQYVVASSVAFGQGVADNSVATLQEQQSWCDATQVLHHVMQQEGLTLLRSTHTGPDGLPGQRTQRGYAAFLEYTLRSGLLPIQTIRQMAHSSSSSGIRRASATYLAAALLRRSQVLAATTAAPQDAAERVRAAFEQERTDIAADDAMHQTRRRYRHASVLSGVGLLYRVERQDDLSHLEAARYAYDTARNMGASSLEAETIALWCHINDGGQGKYQVPPSDGQTHAVDQALRDFVTQTSPRSSVQWLQAASKAEASIYDQRAEDRTIDEAIRIVQSDMSQWHGSDADLLLTHAALQDHSRAEPVTWDEPDVVLSRPMPYDDPVSRQHFDGSGLVRWQQGTQDWLSQDLGKSITSADILSLCGAPSGATVDVQDDEQGGVNLVAQHPLYSEIALHRLRHQEDGSWMLENTSIAVKPSAPAGIGTRLVGIQRHTAQRLGCVGITLLAAGGSGLNGYYTWPRMGFNMQLGETTRTKLQQRDSFRHCVDTNDLMQYEGGPAWWREHGTSGTSTMWFDNDTSNTVWRHYAEIKGLQQVE